MKFYLYFCLFLIFVSCQNNGDKEIIIKTTPVKNSKKEVVKKKLFIDKNFVLGKYNYRKNKNFVQVKKVHSSKTIYLNKEVYTAFVKMFEQAKKDSIKLKIISGTRSFYEQKAIWERKWQKYKSLLPIKRAKKILEYSSMPSTSRHHWGTDVDLNNLNNSYFGYGKGKKEYNWLIKNANKYGFYQVYTNKKNGRTGYNLEKWHWSYLPIAKEYLNYYNDSITYKDIKGFNGSELAVKINMIDQYINGISKKFKEH